MRVAKKSYKSILYISLFLWIMICGFQAKTVYAANKTGFTIINGKSYYLKSDGSKQKGWLNLKGKKYYFDPQTGVQLTGWQKKSNGYLLRYFRNFKGENGYMATGLYKTTNGKTWYFNEKDGMMIRGWKYDKGNHRYFDTKTGIMKTGLNKIGNSYYYFDPSTGYRFKNGLKTINGKDYYFRKTDGRSLVKWITEDGKTRYISTSHVLYKGIRKVGKYYYYFKGSDGILSKEGFRNFGSNTYYFNPSDGHAHIGWLTLNGKKYYFSSKGIMYKNTTKTISGVKYTIAQDGVATKYQESVIETGGKVKVYDQKNGKYYLLAPEYAQHPGVANRQKSDLDVLAALCESEAGDQGKVGMIAVALCILNRTIDPSKEFPSEIRYVVYQQGDFSFPQYSVVRNGSLLRCLNGTYYNKTLAYEAASEAMKIMDNYKKKGTKRKLEGFKDDFDYKYFMMESSFWSMPNLNFSRTEKFLYKDHMFFVDWISY